MSFTEKLRAGARSSSTWVAGAVLWALGGATVGGCSSDIFDVGVMLGAQQFAVDFGQPGGTIPVVACNTQDFSACGTNRVVPLMGDVGQAEIIMGCNAAMARCYAQVNARLFYTVDVLQDEDFVNKVGRRAVSIVRMLDITYSIPANSTTFNIPRMDVYVGPPGSKTESDPGVEAVDTIPALPAGTVVPASSPRHLIVADGSPARDLLESSIQGKVPFVFLLVVSPRIESGAPVPAGSFQVEMVPLLGLGLR